MLTILHDAETRHRNYIYLLGTKKCRRIIAKARKLKRSPSPESPIRKWNFIFVNPPERRFMTSPLKLECVAVGKEAERKKRKDIGRNEGFGINSKGFMKRSGKTTFPILK